MADHFEHIGGERPYSLSLRDLVYVVFRRRLVILAVLLPIVAVASLGLFQDTGSTIAGCKILVELQAPDAPRWNPRSGIDYDRTLNNLMHMAMSAPVARLAAVALEDSVDVIASLDDGAFARLADLDERTQFFYARMNVSPAGESSILNLRLGSRNARLSLMSVTAWRDAFLKYAITATKNTHALEYYDDQVRLVRNELDDLLAQRSRIVAQAGYGHIEFDFRAISQQLIDMRNNNLRNTLERTYLESKVAAMRRSQALDPDYCPTPESGNIGVSMNNVKSRVDQLRMDVMNLLSRFTEEHVEVSRARERLDGARQILATEVENHIQSYELEIEAMRSRESALLAEISNLEQTIAAVPELSRHVALYDTEVAAKTTFLRDLQIKRGEVLLNTGADERIASIIKLTEPEIEVIITEARKFVYFATIVFFGLVFAVIVGIIVDARDHRLHSPERVEAHLGVPVLATVSEERVARAGP